MVPSVLARWLGGVAVVAVILLLAMGTNFRAAIEALKLLGVSEHRPVQALLTREMTIYPKGLLRE